MRYWLLVVLLLSGCDIAVSDASSTPPAPNPVAPQVTAVYANAGAQAAAIMAEYDAKQNALHVTETAVAQNAAERSAAQATLDTEAIRKARAESDQAQLQVTLVYDDLTLNHLRAVSETFVITTSMVLRGQDVNRQLRSEDVGYQAVDWLIYTIPRALIFIGLPIILLLLLRRVGAAVAARAEDVIYPHQKAPPPPPDDDGADHDNTRETGNTVTPQRPGNTVFKTVFKNYGAVLPIAELTREEHRQLENARRDAIVLLERCAQYFTRSDLHDTGQVPRYDALGMQPEYRGRIVNTLVYSNFARVENGRGTYITERGGDTCRELERRLMARELIVLPVGWREKSQMSDDDDAMTNVLSAALGKLQRKNGDV